jgi:hypothetical protein
MLKATGFRQNHGFVGASVDHVVMRVRVRSEDLRDFKQKLAKRVRAAVITTTMMSN